MKLIKLVFAAKITPVEFFASAFCIFLAVAAFCLWTRIKGTQDSKQKSHVDTYPRLTRNKTANGESLEIVFASQRSEVLIAVVQFVVYLVSLMMFVPMVELLGSFDAMAYFGFFAIFVFTTVTAIAVWSALRRKPPMKFCFSSTQLTFNSGVTPVTYLMENYRHPSGFYGRIFRGETSWVLERTESILDPPVDGCSGYISLNRNESRVDLFLPFDIEEKVRDIITDWIGDTR